MRWRVTVVGVGLVLASCASPRRPQLHPVVIHGMRFDPPAVQLAIGDTVEWRNRDLVAHTASAADGHWNSQVILPDSSWRRVFDAPGLQPYGCLLHTEMHAALTVR